jgi:hypothetical protein
MLDGGGFCFPSPVRCLSLLPPPKKNRGKFWNYERDSVDKHSDGRRHRVTQLAARSPTVTIWPARRAPSGYPRTLVFFWMRQITNTLWTSRSWQQFLLLLFSITVLFPFYLPINFRYSPTFLLIIISYTSLFHFRSSLCIYLIAHFFRFSFLLF